MRKITITLISFTLMISVSIGASAQSTMPSWTPIEGDGTLRRIQVPILMYHYISSLPPNADDIRRGLTLSPALFRQHIAYLAENNYNTISLYDLDDALEHGTLLPPNPVILTFDDGYTDAYSEVFPVLRDNAMQGTFFVISQFVDEQVPGYVTWEQIREMADAGMSIEGHTKTHPALVERDADFLVFEVMGGLESIGVHSDTIPRMFAYPIGRYDQTTLRFMASTPIERAVTTQIGTLHTTDNRFELLRMRITDQTGIAALEYLLNYR